MLSRSVYRTMINHLFRHDGFLRNDKGAAAVEFAFVIPFMMLLYFSLVDITGLISLNRRIVSAAATMADLVTQQTTTVLASTIVDQFNAAYVTMQPMPSANLRIEIYGYRYVGSTITLIWKTGNNQGPLCGAAPVTTNMAPMMTNGNDLILARTCTTYSPTIATFMGDNILGATSFTVRQTISARPRQGNLLTCYATTVAAGTLCS